MRSCVLALGGTSIGYAAWNDSLHLLATSALFPLLWSKAPSRPGAGLIAFCYYAAAARGLLHGTRIFFGTYGHYASTLLGMLFIVASSCILTLPWCLLWKRDQSPIEIAWRLPMALTLVSVPPVGCLGWANPVTSAGVLFPGWRWLGLAAVIGVMCLSTVPKRPSHTLVLLVLCILSARFSQDPPKPPDSWKGVDTCFGGLVAQAGFLGFYEQNRQMIQMAMDSKNRSILVFPESVAGRWSQTTQALWEEATKELVANGVTALLGADIFANEDSGSERYDAVIVAVGAESRILYRQRFPMPVSMWRPFCRLGARMHWLDSGVFTLDGHKAAALVCYEQVLIWPVLVSMAHEPNVIIAPANAWWSRNTSIPGIQHAVLAAWSRLFHIPVITAFNYRSFGKEAPPWICQSMFNTSSNALPAPLQALSKRSFARKVDSIRSPST